ncbi:MAG: FAD:protein FMN transferase [Myxococcales bacterium]|nr:FAD:protein FMN transferase [Myxococcales bacterium]
MLVWAPQAESWAQKPARPSPTDGNAVAQVPAQTAAPPAEGLETNLHEDGRPIGGVQVHLRVWLADKRKAGAAITAALKEVRRISAKMSAEQRRSEISGVNRTADKENVFLSRETYDLVQRALHICELTKGAFDLTVQSFDYLWNFKRRPAVRPLDDEIKARLANVGCDHVVLKPNRAIRINSPRGRISVGELLHGHAIARVSQLLQRMRVGSYRLRIGNDVYATGRAGSRHWYVAVAHPLHRKQNIVQLYLTSQTAATRSWSDRFFVKDGKRYHDIINPRTGKPATGVLQATIISTDSVMADALSAAVFSLGAKKGQELLNQLPNVEGFIIDAKGRVLSSRGMENYARLPKTIKL